MGTSNPETIATTNSFRLLRGFLSGLCVSAVKETEKGTALEAIYKNGIPRA
jgi:hypothetical protein